MPPVGTNHPFASPAAILRPLTTSLLVCIAVFTAALPAAQTPLPKHLGKWSPGIDDHLILLNQGWEMTNGRDADFATFQFPAIWDSPDDDIAVRRSFKLPEDAASRHWKLAVDGLGGFLVIKLNGRQLDARRGDGMSFQLDLDERSLNLAGERVNEIELTFDSRRHLRKLFPLWGSVDARRKFGGVSGGIWLTGTPQTAIEDLRARLSQSPRGDSLIVRYNIALRDWAAATRKSPLGLNLKLFVGLPGDSLQTLAATQPVSLTGSGVQEIVGSLNLNRLKLPSADSRGTWVLTASLEGSGFGHHASALAARQPVVWNGSEWLLDGAPRKLRVVNYPASFDSTALDAGVESWKRDLEQLRSLGADAVRIEQGAAPFTFLLACEQTGVAVFEGLPVFQAPDRVLAEPEFIRSAKEALKSLIERDRRFSCIAGWGLGSRLHPPNAVNTSYYQELTTLARSLDDRPVFAGFTISQALNASSESPAPLDFVLVEPLGMDAGELTTIATGFSPDYPMILGPVRRALLPGNLGGYSDTRSEAGQAEYILNLIGAADKFSWCRGVLVGDWLDWMGETPSIAGPAHGRSPLNTYGITDANRQPRLSYMHLKEFWATGQVMPLTRGDASPGRSGILVIGGLALCAILLFYSRSNNIFRMNLARTFTSTAGFFQDLRDQRYFSNGHSVFMAALLSGVFGLLIASWLHLSRESYPFDWTVGWLFNADWAVRFVGALVWKPLSGLLFSSGLVFVMFWVGMVQIILLSAILGVRCTGVQALGYLAWSFAGCLLLLPLGIVAARIWTLGWGWMIWVALALCLVWSVARLAGALERHLRGSRSAILILWLLGPLLGAAVLYGLLAAFRNLHFYLPYLGGI